MRKDFKETRETMEKMARLYPEMIRRVQEKSGITADIYWIRDGNIYKTDEVFELLQIVEAGFYETHTVLCRTGGDISPWGQDHEDLVGYPHPEYWQRKVPVRWSYLEEMTEEEAVEKISDEIADALEGWEEECEACFDRLRKEEEEKERRRKAKEKIKKNERRRKTREQAKKSHQSRKRLRGRDR